MNVKPNGLTELTLLGAPAVHPKRPEWIVLAKARMNAESDSYQSQLVSIRTDTGEERALPGGQGGEAVSGHSPKWSEDGSRIAFLRSVQGRDELWVYDCETQSERRLTPGMKIKEFVWSPNGERIALVSRVQEMNDVCYPIRRLRYKLDGEGMTIGYNHIFAVDVESAAVAQVTSFDSDHSCPVFCDDGSRLAYVVDFPDGDDFVKNPEIHIFDWSANTTSAWNPAVKSISALMADDNGSFFGVGKKHLENSADFDRLFYVTEGQAAEWFAWDIDYPIGYHVISDARRTGQHSAVKYNKKGRQIIFAATAEGKQALFAADAVTRQIHPMPAAFNVVAFDVAACDGPECQIILLADTFHRPAELFQCAWNGLDASGWKQITSCNAGTASVGQSIEVNEYEYMSADGLPVQGWVMYDAAKSPEQTRGSVLVIHGGPHLAYGDSFHFDFWFLCGLGYQVVFCNPRGSSGYGQSFSNAILGEWGAKDATDVLGFLEHVQQEAQIAQPLFVMGGSYGGYLVNWLISHDNRFRAAVAERSICNLHSKINNSDLGFSINPLELGGVDLWRDESFIMERSPIRYAQQVSTPVLLIHAEQDHRCPIEQSEQWFTVLKRLGKKVEFLRFAGSSHAMAASGRPKQRIARLEAIAQWLEEHW